MGKEQAAYGVLDEVTIATVRKWQMTRVLRRQENLGAMHLINKLLDALKCFHFSQRSAQGSRVFPLERPDSSRHKSLFANECFNFFTYKTLVGGQHSTGERRYRAGGRFWRQRPARGERRRPLATESATHICRHAKL